MAVFFPKVLTATISHYRRLALFDTLLSPPYTGFWVQWISSSASSLNRLSVLL
jgi:hypothetical protein